jgi:peptide/nickel transport system permease protein
MSIVFLLPRLVPGDPLDAINAKLAAAGAGAASQALVQDYMERFGFNKPLWQQYIDYFVQLSQGNLGYSIANFPARVSDLIFSALPWTIGLLLITTICSWLIGSLLGAVVGWRESKSVTVRAVVVLALIAYTTPYYILAILLLFAFAFFIPIFPLAGAYEAGSKPEFTLEFIVDVLRHAALPALSIILVSLGWWFLSMRSLMTNIKGEDYILWAEAKGLFPQRILWRYAFRNALLPQATGLALSLGYLVGGALVMEVIFGYPGVGWLLFNSIKGVDYPVIQGSVMLIILSVAIINFIMDLIYPLIDPRIRQAQTG